MQTVEWTSKVKSFGALGYSPERIAVLLGLGVAARDELLLRLADEDDPLAIAYRQGVAIGQYNIDAALMKQAEIGDVDAIKLRAERNAERHADDLRLKLFGI